MTPDEELRQAAEARGVLESRVFQEAKRHLEEQLQQARRAVPISDSAMHTRLILMEQLWGNLCDYFNQIAQTGKMAEIQLREREQKEKSLAERIAIFARYGRNSV